MESYRLSSKLREKDREYLIQTTNDVEHGSVCTTVFVDGVRTDTYYQPHPDQMVDEQLLTLVKEAHGERRRELEAILQAYQEVSLQGDLQAMYRLATAFYYRRFYREAADLLVGAIRIDPSCHQAHYLRSLTFQALGQSVEAVNTAAEAVKYRPGYADYRNNLGEALLSAGAVVEAIAEFEAAVSFNMYYGESYFNLGLARLLEASHSSDPQYRRELGSRISDHFRKAALIHPELENHSSFREGLTLLASYDYSSALGAFKRVREARREAKRQEFIATNQRLMTPRDAWTTEALVEQIRTLQTQLGRHPGYLDLQVELARCYMEQARLQWERAIEECRRIMEAHPDASHVARTLEQARSVGDAVELALATLDKKG
jgi:tetratricopeptide (TPR) repeat protein